MLLNIGNNFIIKKLKFLLFSKDFFDFYIIIEMKIISS